MNKEMMEEMYKSADFFEKHKQEYEETNADKNSIMKIYQRKNSKGKWYKYNTFYRFDNELLQKKANDFVENFNKGVETCEESIMNLGLILKELINRNDSFSPIAQKMYQDMVYQIWGVNYE